MPRRKPKQERRHGDRRQPDGWLVSDWKQAHRWLSVQLTALIGAAEGLWAFAPQLKDYVSPTVFHACMVVLALGVILGRLKNQAKG